jgi:tetraacyldisaccharide 4'-kinase
MKAPNFWHTDGIIPKLLEPAAHFFNLISIINRTLISGINIGVPIICVGNIVSGGAGKTPIALSIGKILGQKYNVGFLTRGHGGSIIGPVQVKTNHHAIDEVGDEALLLTKVAPTWVSKNRKEGALLAKAAGIEVIIMDDGFQNPSVHKDLSLIIIDGPYGFGNGRVIPAGPLREKISNGLIRADIIVVIGECSKSTKLQFPSDLPVFYASITPDKSNTVFSNKNVVGFAGIGRPQKFLTTLKDMGLNVLDFISFPDHYRFSEIEIYNLHSKAIKLNARLVTTAKDLTRVPKNVTHLCKPITVSIDWEDEPRLKELLYATANQNE